MEALRWVLLCEEEVEEEEEPVAEECLLVPLVMGLGRTLARDKLLAVRASLPSCNVAGTLDRNVSESLRQLDIR